MGYEVSRESFDSLKEEWYRLLPNSAFDTIFFTPQWQEVWWRNFANNQELSLIAVRRDSYLVGIAPLMREGASMRLIGSPEVCDYLDFIVVRDEAEAVFRTLWEHLSPLAWQSMELNSVPASSPTLTYLVELARRQNYPMDLSVEDVCPRLELPRDWEQYVSSLSKKDRHELRRKFRRLDSAVSYSHYALTEPEEVKGALPDFFRLHRLSRSDKAAFMTAAMEAFFTDLALCLSRREQVGLYFLELEGVRVASALCFDYNGAVLLYNSGYDPAYHSLSVGLLLKAFCIRDAIERGKGRFDFLRGAESYKYDLGGRDEPIYRCVIQRP